MLTSKQQEVLSSLTPEAMDLMMRVARLIGDSNEDQANRAGEALAAMVLTMPVEDQRIFAESARRFAEILR